MDIRDALIRGITHRAECKVSIVLCMSTIKLTVPMGRSSMTSLGDTKQ